MTLKLRNRRKPIDSEDVITRKLTVLHDTLGKNVHREACFHQLCIYIADFKRISLAYSYSNFILPFRSRLSNMSDNNAEIDCATELQTWLAKSYHSYAKCQLKRQ